jgi:RNA polymerase sigma-70 factor, ECF subfamily
MREALSYMVARPEMKTETVRVPFIGDDGALAQALKAGQPGAREALYERYAHHVRGVLVRTLGTNVDLQDHLHNVFIEAFSSTSGIREGNRLKSWLTSVTVFTAIAHIRRTSRKRWLVFSAPEDLPEIETNDVDVEKRRVLAQVYEILGKMSVKERIPFSLRVIDGMSLQDVADACDVSLATIKRRISKAKQRFAILARNYPSLIELMDDDVSWRQF